MSLKTTIKNDLWRLNYIVPFTKKHQFDEKGKADLMKHVLTAYRSVKPVMASGGRSAGMDVKALLSSVEVEISPEDRFVYFLDTSKTIAVPGNILSNFTLDYDRIIHGTFVSLARAAAGPDRYGRECRLAAEGVMRLNRKILQELEASGEEGSEKKAAWFRSMLTEKAVHFEEALQRILFFNQILWQTRHRLNGLGRLDRILEDLYEADLADGVMTEDGAADMIYDFLECLSRYPDYKSDALEGDIGQIIILGGRNADGSYFSSALTELFLKSQARLGKPDPKTFLRIGAGMPRGILETAVSCLAAKTGSPLFSNDDAVIPALLDAGIDREDAYSYCTSACWEPFIVGKSLDQNNIAVFDCFAALDEILRGDVDAFADFEELAGRYTERNRERFAEFLEGLNALKWAEDPLVSMFTEGCTESRTDISEGGCRYKNYGITTVGLPNAADSLFNIKKLVFDEKQYTLSQMETARRADFAGAEGLYRELKGLPHHFGHDGDEVIAFVNRVTKEMSRAAETYRNPYGGTVKFGLSSPGYNILSKKAAADYAGRKAGMPYNTHISSLDASYTEVASFAGRLDYTDGRFNGNVVDFFAPPDLPERNRGKFVLFLEGAVRAGFFQMQMNILDSATLKDAKAHPEKYRGLIVRVWGFSAYFNELPESYKDLMIERAEAAERIA